MKSAFFTPAHVEIRQRVRALLAAEVLPQAPAWELARRIPKSIWKKLGDEGLLGLHQPKEVGGQALDFFASVVFLEEIGRLGFGGFRAATAVHAYMAVDYLTRYANSALQLAYLAPAIRGEKLAALAISELNAGSDLAQIRTMAIRSGDEYRLSGSKAFVTSGYTADFLVLLVRTSPINARSGVTGLSVMIVDNDDPHIQREEITKIGWHCSDTAHLQLDGVRVPAGRLVGAEGRGFQYAMECLQLERLAASLVALGGAEACLALTQEYMQRRMLYGAPLAALQAPRHRFADISTELCAARQLVYHAAWLYDHGEHPVLECSMAKLKATEVANRIVDECLQLHGGYGYSDTSAIARMYRDARLATIVGGASEVMRDIIAQAAVDGMELGTT